MSPACSLPEEPNFTFSYNITSLTAAMRKALNRERTNVGRTAYSDRVKQMLLASNSSAVAKNLEDDLERIQTGTNQGRSEMDRCGRACRPDPQWIAECRLCQLVRPLSHRDAIDHAQADGLKVVTLPDNIKDSLQGVPAIKGNPVRDLAVYQDEWAQSFELKFIAPNLLSSSERRVFDHWKAIAKLVGGLPAKVRGVKISETMRPDFSKLRRMLGLWDEGTASIVIKRTQLASLGRVRRHSAPRDHARQKWFRRRNAGI